MHKYLLVIPLFLLSCTVSAAPKNIIYMIGDGMGPAYLTAYRYYMDNPATPEVETTIFDELLRGVASTYPDDDTVVTDSAAAATALATGFKTYNGGISVNRQHIPLDTMMQFAKRLGKANGIVASSQVNHATPAAFLAHNKSRRAYNEIADMYFDYRIQGRIVADVILGGGTRYFIREDRNLVAEFQQAGYQYTDSWQDLDNLTKAPALALLADVSLPAVLNSDIDSQLATLTRKALELLTPAEKGFVLMVEGSQIDWCGHDNDIACLLAEMHDFAKAVKVAKEYVDQHPDTLLVITADHETGGLSVGADGIYAWHSDVIKNIKVTGRLLAEKLQKADSDATALTLWQQLTAIELTEAQQQLLLQKRSEASPVFVAQLLDFISKASLTGWTSGNHTAIDVPVMAYGKWKNDFNGFQDNTQIAKKLIQYIQQTK